MSAPEARELPDWGAVAKALGSVPGVKAAVEIHPQEQDVTRFPSGLEEFFAASGFRLTWQMNNPNYISMLSVQKYRKVDPEEISKEVWESIPKEQLDEDRLKEGIIARGDCILMKQPIRAHREIESTSRKLTANDKIRQDVLKQIEAAHRIQKPGTSERLEMTPGGALKDLL